MFIIFGWNHIDSTEYGIIKEEYCAHCHNTEIWNLRKTKNYLTIFFIPIFPYESFNFYYCPICNYGIKLSNEDFIYYKKIGLINRELENNSISVQVANKKIEEIKSLIDKSNEQKEIKIINESKNWIELASEKSDDDINYILDNYEDYNPAFVIAIEEEKQKREKQK